MKTRQGFVSNSSSSSFIVAITKDFKVTEQLAEVIFEQCDWACDLKKREGKEAAANIEKIIFKALKDVKRGNNIIDNHHNYTPVCEIADYFEKQGMLLATTETGVDGHNTLTNILTKENIEKLKKLIK